MTRDELLQEIQKIERKMRKAADNLDFETAAQLRDKMIEYKKAVFNVK